MAEVTSEGTTSETPPKLVRQVVLRLVMGMVVIGAMLFWPAGTFRYWAGWMFFGALFGPMGFVLIYLVRHDPALLARRMQMKEQRGEQRTFIKLASLLFFAAFLVPGFDHRFGWSSVPWALVIAANVMVMLGYGLFFWVMKVNSFAARTVEVAQEQEVISTGPYARVRHPMYTATLLMMLPASIGLGSWWALPPLLLLIPLLVARIRDEERMLRDELAGYREYCGRVRWRLVPGLW